MKYPVNCGTEMEDRQQYTIVSLVCLISEGKQREDSRSVNKYSIVLYSIFYSLYQNTNDEEILEYWRTEYNV